MRATRDGGSPSSARALGATKSSKPDKHMITSALLFPAKMAFMLFPQSSAASPEARPIRERIRSHLVLPDTPSGYNPVPTIKLLMRVHMGTAPVPQAIGY